MMRAVNPVLPGALVLTLCLAGMRAADVPEGALWIRLSSALSTRRVALGDRVEAVTIATLTAGGHTIVPPGCRVSGRVLGVSARAGLTPQAWIDLAFDTIVDAAGEHYSAAWAVAQVDNARETVTDQGRILALKQVSVLPRGTDSILLLAAHAHPVVAAALETGALVKRQVKRPEISYDAGTEMMLRPVDAIPETWALACNGPTAPERPPDAAVDAVVHGQAWRAEAGNPPKPSDVVNLLFVGDRAAIERAFQDAGWTTADAASLRADLRVFLAVAKKHGYQQGPVSRLTLDGAGPDLVFQKQNNTFAKRHHVRIWSKPVTLAGRPAWPAAATHDVGIKTSRETKLFNHRIDPNIDDERLKIVNDLTFAGAVEALTWVQRPDVTARMVDAAGDAVVTDGRLAVVWLAPPRTP